VRDDRPSIERGADELDRRVASARAPEVSEAEPATASAAAGDLKPDASEIERLAALRPLEYERVRKDEAVRLHVRVPVLDKLVTEAREARVKRQSDGKMFRTVEPWPEEVDGQQLLDELAATFRRFVILPTHAAETLALWTILTYTHDCFQHSPILLPRSATKRCGKSTLVSLLAELVHRGLPASNLTPAVIFRVIEQHHPTLLIDEVDSFMDVSEEMRGILNSGHQRSTAMVYRVEEVNGQRETVGFSTWAPKLLAMIGKPPATILDRAISIKMERKLRGDTVEKRRHTAVDMDGLRRRCVRWASNNAEALTAAWPEMPDALNDRQADSWEPLIAIADCAGPLWAERARQAALVLCEADAVDLDQAELGEELLRDVRGLFDARANRKLRGEVIDDTDRLSSADMVSGLLALNDRPWAEANRGKPITQHWLARWLATFSITVKNVRFADGRVLKGYTCEQFADAWCRYLGD
jgi:putative DNA primase/helicase